MLNINTDRDQISPREFELHQWETEDYDKRASHALEISKLNIEVKKLEAKITSWFKLPIYIIELPIKLLLIIPICISLFVRKELPKSIWEFFTGRPS